MFKINYELNYLLLIFMDNFPLKRRILSSLKIVQYFMVLVFNLLFTSIIGDPCGREV